MSNKLPLLVALTLFAPVAFPASVVTKYDLASNYDGSRSTEYQEGNKPQESCTNLSGWTLLKKGTADGEVCDQGGNAAEVTALGTNDEGNQLLSYKSCGTGDCQVIATVPAGQDWSGWLETFTTFGVGLTEGTGDSAYYAQAWATSDGRLRCKAGTPGPDDFNSQTGTGQLPAAMAMTNDDSADEIRCLYSLNGTDYITYGTISKALAEPYLGYFFGTSHSLADSTTATLTNISHGTTITVYTPTDPDPDPVPELVTPIPNQEGTQGVAFSLDISANFTGETSYTASGLPGSTGLSFNTSTGVLSGTPTSSDRTNSPYNLSMCGVNAAGSTCQSVQFSFSQASGSGSVFLIPDVGDSVDSTFDGSATNGANGSSWASIRTSGSATKPGPGDTVLITSGTRGDIFLKNFFGTKTSPITINKTVSSTRLIFAGNDDQAGGGSFQLDNVVGVNFFPDNNWTGHTGGCGAIETATGLSPTPATDCGVLIHGTNIYWHIKIRGERKFITFQNIEIDGDWPGPCATHPGTCTQGSHYGIGSNDQTYCPAAPNKAPTDPTDTQGEWAEGHTFKNIYIHDITGSALYLGQNNSTPCGGGYQTIPNQRGLLVENIYVLNAGSNGPHVKRISGSDPSQAIIRNNYIKNTGGNQSNGASGAVNHGIDLYEASGTITGNVVDTIMPDDPSGPCIAVGGLHRPPSFGTQVTEVYNNIVIGCQNAGINASRQACSGILGTCGGQNPTGTTAQSEIHFYNNTIVNPDGACLNAASSVGGGFMRNNLCAGKTTINGANQTKANNVTHSSASAAGFNNLAGDDFRLTSGSDARNGGTNTNCADEDIVGTTRPKEGTCDAGAFEYVP